MAGNGLLIFLIIVVYLAASGSSYHDEDQMWQCHGRTEEEAVCRKLTLRSLRADSAAYPSLEICRLDCGKYRAMWPQPTGDSTFGYSMDFFSLNSVHFNYPDNDEIKSFLQKATTIFTNSVSHGQTVNCSTLDTTVTVFFSVVSNDTTLTWSTNESYTLEIISNFRNTTVKITSQTVFGSRHALETLSQFIDIYPRSNGERCYVIQGDTTIRDAPVYPHRGLLLDTARNFQSVESIKRHMDAMGYSKLNVLHWHVTDSQSFPLKLPSLPNMTKFGAYSDDKIYHPEDVADIVSYAKLRGVRVIIEFDSPSHAGNGWQWGPEAGLGNLAVCINQQPWRSYCIQPPCGQLNPVSTSLNSVLKDLYSDVMKMLPKGEVFHMGGDEVYIPCWNATPEILTALEDKPRTTKTFLDLWANFQSRALACFDTVVGNRNTKIILWSSPLTEVDVIEKYLSKNRYVIQTWVPASDGLPQDLLDLGYQIIVSTKDAWYLDHGFWGSTVYHNWRVVYNNKIPTNKNTLGGEVCMWGEYVDDSSVQSRVWPRAAAAAERLWSDPKTDAAQAELRFYRHRERLVSRGIYAEALIPRWCYLNEKEC